MASKLLTARTSVVTVIEALTPPSETGRTYRHLASERYIPSGASSHRCFWFEPDSGNEQINMIAIGAHYEHAWSLNVKLSTAGTNVATGFDMLVNEAVMLVRAINKQSSQSWGSGVDMLWCDGYELQEDEGDDFILVLKLRAHTIETD